MAVAGDGDDVLAYTKKWMVQVNRGGLFPLNDNTFLLFTEIKKCLRFLLPQSMICNDSDKASFKKSVLDKIIIEKKISCFI